ncbi:MAG TPA: ComF family protein [Dehalococcoidia bacterium]|nr:ComF family protein [Dehalococcoidia bacterium]
MELPTLSRLGRLAVDLLYPPLCALCGRPGALLCDACLDSFPPAGGRRCGCCWLPLAPGGCRSCLAHPVALRRIRSAYRYAGPARELVHRFKFGDLTSLAEVMAPPMASLVEWPIDAVAPVPLTPTRERERGYNQAALLARGVGRALGAPVVTALKRTRSGRPQARSAGADERRGNVAGAFAVRDAGSVRDRSVLLVDDVATTGATLDACARALLDAGAREVTAVTFARED